MLTKKLVTAAWGLGDHSDSKLQWELLDVSLKHHLGIQKTSLIMDKSTQSLFIYYYIYIIPNLIT